MDEITTVGLDLAKNVFRLVGFNARGQEVKKKVLRRGQVLSFFAQLPASLVAWRPVPGPTTGRGRLQEHGKDDRLSRWAQRIRAERGFNKAVAALANKLARIGWALLRNNTTYQPA